MRIVATPAYMTADPAARNTFQAAALGLLGGYNQQPSMAFGDPTLDKVGYEDLTPMEDGTEQHLSVHVPVSGTERLWCKRDDYPDGPVFTFLLPSDY